MKEYLCCIPLDEAIKVLMIYKDKSFIPSKDYVDGFDDGYKKAQTDFESGLKKAMYNAISDSIRELIMLTSDDT